MAKQKRSTTPQKAPQEVMKALDKVLSAALAVTDLADGMARAETLPFSGHTLGHCIYALLGEIKQELRLIDDHIEGKAQENYLTEAFIALEHAEELTQINIRHQDEVEKHNAVGGALSALLERAALSINRMAWASGVAPLEFSIGDFGLLEWERAQKKAA